ncbi:MAG TPA: hypothetical protein VKZ89_04195, partial [Thermobifida alba]|nr:hypothetical protein [Thermobifida alba]
MDDLRRDLRIVRLREEVDPLDREIPVVRVPLFEQALERVAPGVGGIEARTRVAAVRRAPLREVVDPFPRPARLVREDVTAVEPAPRVLRGATAQVSGLPLNGIIPLLAVRVRRVVLGTSAGHVRLRALVRVEEERPGPDAVVAEVTAAGGVGRVERRVGVGGLETVVRLDQVVGVRTGNAPLVDGAVRVAEFRVVPVLLVAVPRADVRDPVVLVRPEDAVEPVARASHLDPRVRREVRLGRERAVRPDVVLARPPHRSRVRRRVEPRGGRRHALVAADVGLAGKDVRLVEPELDLVRDARRGPGQVDVLVRVDVRRAGIFRGDVGDVGDVAVSVRVGPASRGPVVVLIDLVDGVL